MSTPQSAPASERQAVLIRVGRLARNVGFLTLAASVFGLFTAAVEAIAAVPTASAGGFLIWLKGWFTGSNALNLEWVHQLTIEVPFGILVGWGLIRLGRLWNRPDLPAEQYDECLLGGLEQLVRVLRVAYIRAIALTVLIWAIVLFA